METEVKRKGSRKGEEGRGKEEGEAGTCSYLQSWNNRGFSYLGSWNPEMVLFQDISCTW